MTTPATPPGAMPPTTARKRAAHARRQADLNRDRMNEAVTAEGQLTVAYDWLRMAARYMPPDDSRAELLRRATRHLVELAHEAESRRDYTQGVRDYRKANLR